LAPFRTQYLPEEESMAHRVKVTLEHHLNRRYHAVNHGRGRRPADTKYGKFNLRFRHEGKRIRLPLEATDLSAALQARSDKEEELNAIPVFKRKGVTLDEAINIYLTTRKAAHENWRKHTVQCYALALKLFRQSCGRRKRPSARRSTPPQCTTTSTTLLHS